MSWADKAIDDMKASYEAELSTLRTRIEELERERDNDDLPQAPWPASDWAVNRIAELEQKLERVLGSLTRMTDIAEARLVMITDLESRLAEARADALEVQVNDDRHFFLKAKAAEERCAKLEKALGKVCTAIEREPVCGGDLDYPHGHNDWLGWRKKIMRPAAEFARAALDQDKGGK